MTQLALTRFLYDRHAADREPVTVFDVGCSGGIGAEWDVFGRALRATGFDPLVLEIERLRAADARPNLTYEDGFVGLKPAQLPLKTAHEAGLPERRQSHLDWVKRSSCERATQLRGIDHISKYYNAGNAPRYSERRIAIDDYTRDTGCSPDILKIDTDGFDMEVLLGAEHTISASVLAVKVECNFHSSLSQYASNPPAIDVFLRERGLQMYVIEPYRYTRGALPGPFQYEMFAQTEGGQVIWADMLYLRDLALPDYERIYGFAVTLERVLKLAAVMEMFGLGDCAAELLDAHATRLPYAREQMLDLLVPGHLGHGLSYRDYIARFDADPAALLPSRLGKASAPAAPLPQPFVRAMRPIDLGRACTQTDWGAELRHGANGMTVMTGAVPWAYAALIPWPADDRPSSIELDVSGVLGRIGFMLVGDNATQLSEHALLDGGCGAAVVVLPIPAGITATGVIVRNASEDGSPSAVTIASARMYV